MVMSVAPSPNDLDMYDGFVLVRHGQPKNRTKRGLTKHTHTALVDVGNLGRGAKRTLTNKNATLVDIGTGRDEKTP